MTHQDEETTRKDVAAPIVVAEAPPAEGITRRSIMQMITAAAAAITPPIALSTAAGAEPVDDGQEAYENGLEVAQLDVALAWLQQWTAQGGSVTLDRTDPDKAWIGRPAFDLSPAYASFEQLQKQVEAQDWYQGLAEPEQKQDRLERERFCRDRYEGKMEGLYDLLCAMPHVLKALKQAIVIAPGIGVHFEGVA